MNNKTAFYVFIDVILAVGIILNYFVFPDTSFVGITICALLMNLLHQKYDEKKYFKGMFDQGRPVAIWGWILIRWMLTGFALVVIVVGLLDYFGI